MNKIIRIGTKGNKLGLWQAEYVANLIKPSGYTTEIISVRRMTIQEIRRKILK